MSVFTWSGDKTTSGSKPARDFDSEAESFGISSGMTIPVRTAFGHMAMLTSVRIGKTGLPEAARRTRIELAARQALCFKWSAEGKSMRAIAQIENMSLATVNFLNNARKALDAGSLPQAIATATKLKLI